MKTEVILRNYSLHYPMFSELQTLAEKRIRERLEAGGVAVAGVRSRIKSRTSLLRKLAAFDRSGIALDEIDDLVGIRIEILRGTETSRILELLRECFGEEARAAIGDSGHIFKIPVPGSQIFEEVPQVKIEIQVRVSEDI